MKKIRSVESEMNLFEQKPHSAQWDYVRFKLWQRLRNVSQPSVHTNDKIPSEDGTKIKHRQLVSSIMKNIAIDSPWLLDKKEILFHGFSRRSLQNDGFYWCIHTDPIINELRSSYILLENPRLSKSNLQTGKLHNTPAKTDNIYYTDLFTLIETSAKKLGLIQNITQINDISMHLYRASVDISKEFSPDIDVKKIIKSVMLRRTIETKIYRHILKQVEPSIVVIVNRGQKLALIEACDMLNIPTVLLQQGAVYRSHVGFSYPENISVPTFPDYIFTFGQFWNELIDVPIPDDHVIPVGWPYLEKEVEKRETKIKTQHEKRIIIVLSQPHIGDRMAKLAVYAAKCLENYKIIFKPHPNVGVLASEIYPQLVNSEVTIVTDESLYDLFSTASIQIGYSSTALFEGIEFGLRTFVLSGSDAEHVDKLCELSNVVSVGNPPEFCKQVVRQKGSIDNSKGFVFEKDSLKKTLISLEEIINKNIR